MVQNCKSDAVSLLFSKLSSTLAEFSVGLAPLDSRSAPPPGSSWFEIPKGIHISPFKRMLNGLDCRGAGGGFLPGSISRSKVSGQPGLHVRSYGRDGVVKWLISTLGMGREVSERRYIPGKKIETIASILSISIILNFLIFILIFLSIFFVFYEVLFKFAPYIIYSVFWKVKSVIGLPHFWFLFHFKNIIYF